MLDKKQMQAAYQQATSAIATTNQVTSINLTLYERVLIILALREKIIHTPNTGEGERQLISNMERTISKIEMTNGSEDPVAQMFRLRDQLLSDI